MRDLLHRIRTLLDRWPGVVASIPMRVLLVVMLLTGGLGWVTATRLGMNTDTTGMLSAHLSWRQAYTAYAQAFPTEGASLVVLIEGRPETEVSDDALGRVQSELLTRVRAEPSLFPSAVDPSGRAFFEPRGLLLIDDASFDESLAQLGASMPLLTRLRADPSLASVLDSLALGLRSGRSPESLAPLSVAASSMLRGDPSGLGAMFRPDVPGPSYRVLLVTSRLDYEQLPPGGAAVSRLREIIDALGCAPSGGDSPVRCWVTGAVALEADEFESLGADALTLTAGAIGLVCVVLLVGLRSIRKLLAALITVIVGLVATAAWASVTVGELNLISVAFAALYVGLGIDYPIHLGMRYREVRAGGVGHVDALRRALADVGPSLALCAVTTSIGFLSFVPTSFKGVSELGLIAAGGIFLSLVICWVVYPALISLRPAKVRVRATTDAIAPSDWARGVRRPVVVIGLTVVVALACGLLVPRATFDSSRLSMRDPGTPSAIALERLAADPDSGTLVAVGLAPDASSALETASALEALEPIRSARVLPMFVVPPAQQADRIERLAGLRELFESVPLADGRASAGVSAMALGAVLSGVESTEPSIGAVRAALEAYLADEDAQRMADAAGGVGVRDTMTQLGAVLAPAPYDVSDLPPELVRMWRSMDGRYRIEIHPAEPLVEGPARRRFVDAVLSVMPQATGEPVINVQAGGSVVEAFQQALGLALGAIAVLLLVLLRSVRDALAVMVPLVLALLITVAVSVLVGISFNFANVIALPLILGIGVDGGIHMVHRMRSGDGGRSVDPLRTATAHAVVISSMTTVGGFGGLLLSSHAGTASLGSMLLIGTIASMGCTLFVLPALMVRRAG